MLEMFVVSVSLFLLQGNIDPWLVEEVDKRGEKEEKERMLAAAAVVAASQERAGRAFPF